MYLRINIIKRFTMPGLDAMKRFSKDFSVARHTGFHEFPSAAIQNSATFLHSAKPVGRMETTTCQQHYYSTSAS